MQNQIWWHRPSAVAHFLRQVSDNGKVTKGSITKAQEKFSKKLLANFNDLGHGSKEPQGGGRVADVCGKKKGQPGRKGCNEMT